MEFVKMKSIAAYRQLHKHSRKIVALFGLFTGFLFLVLVFSSAVIIKTAGNSNLLAAGGATATVDWSSNTASFRYTVCLAGTSQCQPTYKTTTGNSGSWTLASLVNYDVHIDISPDGSSWSFWEKQTNVGLNCYGPATCSKSFNWAKVDYHVATNLDGNVDHIVTQPGTSYSYTNVPANTSYSGTVQFKDYDNYGSSHVVKNVSGTSSGFPYTLGNPTVSGTTATFSISNGSGGGAGTSSILYIKDLATSIPIPTGATSIQWTGAAGAHQAVISAFGVDVSNTVSFTLVKAGFSFTLGNPTVSGNIATFSITPNSGASSVLYIKDLATSIPIPTNVASIQWTGAAGAHQAVISAFGVDVSNTVSFSINTATTGGTAAKLLMPTTQCVNGVVTAHFSWTAAVPPTGTTFDIQRMDLSDGSSMVPGTYFMLSLTPSATTKDFSSVPAGVMLYWRIESHVKDSGVPGTVLISSTGSVKTTSCGVTISSAGTPAKLVTPASGTCMSDGRDQLIFSWTRAVPPTGYTIDLQKIGVSNEAVGPFIRANILANIASTTRTLTLTGGAGQTLYWIIDTHFTNGTTLTSAVGTMVAPPCVATSSVGTPAKLNPVNVTCSSTTGVDTAVFSWTRGVPPTGATITLQKIGLANAAIGPYTKADLSAGDTSRTGTIPSGQTFYWIIDTQFSNGTILTSASGQFNTPPCGYIPPPAGSGRSASPQQIMDYINAQTADGLGNPFIIPFGPLAGYDFGEVLYGIAGCETGGTWDPHSINPNGHYGIFQFDQATWDGNNVFGYASDDYFDAYRASDVTINLLQNANFQSSDGFGKWSCTPYWQNYVGDPNNGGWHR